MITKDSRPITSLITQVVSDLAFLLQTEIRLARAEMSEKLDQAANGGMLLGIAAVILLPGVFILMLAIVAWLAIAGLPQQWGLSIVGLAAVGGGVALAMAGVNRFKGSNLVPERTIGQVRADITVAKEHMQ